MSGVNTGAFDHKGTPICEGDLVKAYKPNSGLDGVYVVRWHPTRYSWHYWDEQKSSWAEGNGKPYLIGNNKAGAWCEVTARLPFGEGE